MAHIVPSGRPDISANYRPDIDGLRAVAVIPVVLFHSELGLFPGGYVGVDIFFVISGYLISTILLNDISRNQYSIVKFYERRIRRIFPALFLVLLVSTIVAFLILLPVELDKFGSGLFAATFFYSNYYFMFDTGYFAEPAETNPLLHLWSLAVEEQFYIVFPVYLYLAARFFRGQLGQATFIVLLASVIYSMLLVSANPGDAFYSAPARAWELLLGALLAIYPRGAPLNRQLAELLGAAGAALIIYAILFYSEATPFPGAAAILPCAGAALIIYTGQANATFTGRLLSTSAFRFPGLISYSLYLWHWPVLVFYKMYAITQPSHLETALLFVVMTAAAWASWKFAEAPFRTRQLLRRQRSLFAAGGGVMLASAAIGVIIGLADGFPARLPDRINQILAAREDGPGSSNFGNLRSENGKFEPTHYIGAGEPGKASFAVWGDSHAEAMLPAVSASAAKFGLTGIFIGTNGCPTLLGAVRINPEFNRCRELTSAFMTYLPQHPEIGHVVLISRWAINATGERYKNEKGASIFTRDSETVSLSYDENRRVFKRALERTFAQLASWRRSIILVTEVPETGWHIPDTAARIMLLGHDIELRPSAAEYAARQAFVTSVIEENRDRYGLTLVRPQDRMCGSDYCAIFDGDTPLYKDDDHITGTYALKLSSLFDPVFSAMQPDGAPERKP